MSTPAERALVRTGLKQMVVAGNRRLVQWMEAGKPVLLNGLIADAGKG